MSATRATRRHPGVGSVLLAATTCTLALAACGSAGKPPASSAGISPQAVKYAACMRFHGVPRFSDVDAQAIQAVLLATRNSPAFRSAEKACASLRPHASGSHTVSESTKPRLLALARCMRTHGVPNLPDPTFAPEPGGVAYLDTADIDTQSPAFRRAATVCHFPVPPVGPGGTPAP